MHFQRPQCRNSKYYRWEPSLLHYNNLNLWIGGLKLKILYIMNRMHLHLHLQHLYLYSLSLNSQNHIRTIHGLQAPSLIGQKFGVCLVKIIRAIHTLHSLGAFYYTPTTYLSKVYHWTLENIYAPYTGSRFPLKLVTKLVFALWKSYAPYTLYVPQVPFTISLQYISL